MSVFPKTSGKQFCQRLSMLSGPLFVFQLMKLPMNASCGSPARPWLVLRSLRGYCIQVLFFYVAMFETRTTPYATRFNSWRVIRRILWYVLVMAKKARFPHLTWRLFPGLQQLSKSSRQTSPRIPRLRAVWTVSYPIALAIRRLPLSRQGWPPRRRALTPFRHRRVPMCHPYVGRQASGNPLIVLVIGRYNFKGGRVWRFRCQRLLASGCWWGNCVFTILFKSVI